MCLVVYPNGNGDGEGTHVSIFTCVMRGPFDAELHWPFRGAITIQVLNQSGDHSHREQTITYDDCTPDIYAGRVMDKEKGGAWGYAKFLPHSSLDTSTTSNTQYLKNNSLCIKVVRVSNYSYLNIFR